MFLRGLLNSKTFNLKRYSRNVIMWISRSFSSATTLQSVVTYRAILICVQRLPIAYSSSLKGLTYRYRARDSSKATIIVQRVYGYVIFYQGEKRTKKFSCEHYSKHSNLI